MLKGKVEWVVVGWGWGAFIVYLNIWTLQREENVESEAMVHAKFKGFVWRPNLKVSWGGLI